MTPIAPPYAPLPGREDPVLRHTWEDRPGFIGWLTTVDHKRIAIRYIVTALVFLLLGGVEAAMMRAQLARPENNLIGPDLYNQIFTMHGSTMMFLFAVPVMTAVGLYLVPLMIGARNIVFPRLNALGYWVYLAGGVLLYAGFVTNTGPDAGWFNYVPLAGPGFSPGKRIDIWAQTVTFTEISALITAVELIITTLRMRAPGMTLRRLPLFVWAQLVTACMIIFAMPAVATDSLLLALDRLVGTHFFNPAEGGDVLLWQHLFWFFGHPEVYIIFVPALGMVSSIVSALTGREIFGYRAMVLALWAVGFLSFLLWVHHMFTSSIPMAGSAFFTISSSLIAVPSGIQIFCWIATIWLGRPRFAVPLLFVAGFVVLFLIGGLTGVMVASVPFDLQVHDTYFVVAHLHYVLLGGALFPLFGAFYFWFPKVTGRMLSERAGRWNFWLFFTGVNLTFFPMHFLGFAGMPRRVYTYLAETGWGELNLLATIGAAVIAVSVLVFLGNVVRSLLHGEPAGPNPWNAESLEWGTTSPPPPYNFDPMPAVNGRSPLWDLGPEPPRVIGLRSDRREVLVTTVMEAEADHRHLHPEPSAWPAAMGAASTVTIVLSIFTPWGLVIGSPLLLVAMVGWAWPHGEGPVAPSGEAAA